MVTKNYLIKDVSYKNDTDGERLLVSLVTPPKTIGGMTLVSVEQPIVAEVPTKKVTLLADLARYAAGNTVPVTFGDPVAPASSTSTTTSVAA